MSVCRAGADGPCEAGSASDRSVARLEVDVTRDPTWRTGKVRTDVKYLRDQTTDESAKTGAIFVPTGKNTFVPRDDDDSWRPKIEKSDD